MIYFVHRHTKFRAVRTVPAPTMYSSRRRGGFESGCSRHFSPRTPYQSFHSDYHVLMVSARQRQLWGSMRYGFPNLRGTLYQEKENLPLRAQKSTGQDKG